MSKVVRLQIELDQDQIRELDDLAEMGGLRTRKEFFNNAFTLMKWAVRERRQARSIGSLDQVGGTYRELTTPYLDSVAETAESYGPHRVGPGYSPGIATDRR